MKYCGRCMQELNIKRQIKLRVCRTRNPGPDLRQNKPNTINTTSHYRTRGGRQHIPQTAGPPWPQWAAPWVVWGAVPEPSKTRPAGRWDVEGLRQPQQVLRWPHRVRLRCRRPQYPDRLRSRFRIVSRYKIGSVDAVSTAVNWLWSHVTVVQISVTGAFFTRHFQPTESVTTRKQR